MVHVGLARPVVGALICAAFIGGGMSMTGTPDAFGGCGEPGGELHRVVELNPDDPQSVCAVLETPPVAVSK